MHDLECGQEIAEEEHQERERQHEHLAGRRKRGQQGKAVPARISCPAEVPTPTPGPRSPLSTTPPTAGFCQRKAEIWADWVTWGSPRGQAGSWVCVWGRAPPSVP